MFLNVLPDVCLCSTCAPGVHGGQKGVTSLESVIHDCKSPSGCWELNAGPLQELQVFLSSELFLWPLKILLLQGQVRSLRQLHFIL